MSDSHITISIEGDFVNSFIYSGTLFLVNTDSLLSTYNWEDLLDFVLDKNVQSNLKQFLVDYRKGYRHEDQQVSRIFIDKQQLSKHLIDNLPLNGWPTDICIYSNRLYLADENGVDTMEYSWKEKTLDTKSRFKIWNKYAYKVSPNVGQRVAISAGENGVITAFPRKSYIDEKKDIITILKHESYDCEWIGTNLVSNSLNESYISIFPELPSTPSEGLNEKNKQAYYDELNRLKKESPETRALSTTENNVSYAWVAGGKIFSLLGNGYLSVVSSQASKIHQQINITKKISRDMKILSARSGTFGTVIETDKELISITENNIEIIANRPANWKVFPRARNYINHLHVIENDHLLIRAYYSSSDIYGVKIEEVI